jgi:hypothetical protein
LLARANAAAAVVPASSIEDLRVLEVDRDRRGSYPITIGKDTCKLVIAALGPEATGVELQVVDVAGNKVAGKSHGGNVASVRVCGGDTPLHAEVRLAVSAGKTKALAGTVGSSI